MRHGLSPSESFGAKIESHTEGQYGPDIDLCHSYKYDLDMTIDAVIGEAAGPDFKLDRPLESRPWTARDVEIEAGRLKWCERPGEAVSPSRGLLEAFIRLDGAPDDAVLRFAKRWGPLGLCEHGFPASHPGDYWPTRPVEFHPCPDRPTIGEHHRCIRRGYHEDARWEPITEWRQWTKLAKATLEFVVSLQQPKVPPIEMWGAMCALEGSPTGSGFPGWPRTRENAQAYLAMMIGYWLRAANLQLSVEIGQRAGITWGSLENPVFGAIAMQLALVASGKWGLAICSGCGTSYAPSRQPREKTRHYCLACSENGVPKRDASRAYRRRSAKPRQPKSPSKTVPLLSHSRRKRAANGAKL
jgi:hypothetical protein